ncbi:MAG: hypothetical protein AAF849_08215 [Bacteroidota bacterium]
MENQPKKKRIIKPYELILLVIIGFIFIHLGLKSVGINTVNRSEEVNWLDRPSGPEAPISLEDRERDQQVDEVLENIAVQFAEDRRRNRTSSKRDLKKKGLSEDEAKYYKDVQQREATEGMSPSDWVDAVQTSYKTYKTVKNIFDTVDGRQEEKLDTEDMERVLSDAELRNRTFSNLEQTFNIARPQLEAFAQRGSRALSDWATFVDENKQE